MPGVEASGWAVAHVCTTGAKLRRKTSATVTLAPIVEKVDAIHKDVSANSYGSGTVFSSAGGSEMTAGAYPAVPLACSLHVE